MEDDSDDEFDWLVESDENILTASSCLVFTKDNCEDGISMIVGDDSHCFEIVFTRSELKRMLREI